LEPESLTCDNSRTINQLYTTDPSYSFPQSHTSSKALYESLEHPVMEKGFKEWCEEMQTYLKTDCTEEDQCEYHKAAQLQSLASIPHPELMLGGESGHDILIRQLVYQHAPP
jgi:hypothetical protein